MTTYSYTNLSVGMRMEFKIQNQTFLNEINLNQYIEWNALARIIFLNFIFE